jgi:hypothetical protein
MECLDIEPREVVDAALSLLDLRRPGATNSTPALAVSVKP